MKLMASAKVRREREKREERRESERERERERSRENQREKCGIRIIDGTNGV